MAMTKEELIETIDSTIVSNGVKGITARSLANILTEIVETMGTGNGAGGEYIDLTMADSENFVLTEKAKAHNAEVYTKLLDAMFTVGAVPSVCLNGDGNAVFINEIIGNLAEDGTVESISLILQMPMEMLNVMFKVMDGLSESEVMMVAYPTALFILNLTPDGSIVILSPGLD